MARQDSEEKRSNTGLHRRSWLKGIGAAVGAAGLVGVGAGDAAAAEYETVTLSSGESRQFSVAGGETLENLLVDVSASGADAQFRASGDDWTIRNVAVTGQTDVHKNDGFWAVFLCEGNGVVENCYLGDGATDGRNKTAMGVPSRHSGSIQIRNCYVANWADNGIYASHAAEGGNGTVHVQDCYLHDNNVAHIRIASEGSVAEGCVVHNTNNVPAISTGDVHSKGSYTGYGSPDQVVEIRNCDVEVTDGNTNGDCDAFNSNDSWHSEMSTIRVVDTQYRGSVHGPYVEFGSGNGNEPDLTPPAGVPSSAEEAASGTSDGSDDSSGDDGSDDDGSDDDGPDDGSSDDGSSDDGSNTTRTLTVDGTRSSGWAPYEITVTGDIQKGDRSNGHDAVEGSTAKGFVRGGVDTYTFTGEVDEMRVDGRLSVTIDGGSN